MAGLFGGGGLLGGSGGLAGELGIPESTEADNGDPYEAPLTPTRFDDFGATLSQGRAVEIARVEIPPETSRRWGFGSAQNEANQGWLFGQFYNANDEQIHGKLIFKWENATGRQSETIAEVDTKDIDTTDRYNRDQQKPMPEATNKNKANAFQYLIVEMEAETDPSTITNDYKVAEANSDARMPTTEYDLQ